MKKLLLTTALIACCLTSLLAQPCLPEGITFTTQTQIDSFQINYPGCTEIEGNVSFGAMSGSNINNLDSLNVLTSIGGGVCFGWMVGTFTGGTGLTDLSGLDNLTSIGEGLWIRFHSNLTSLTGLEGLTSIGGELAIMVNGALTSLTGLENLTSIGGSIEIHNNNTLTSLMGLNNLTSIGSDLEIRENEALISLTGLENINSASIENLIIKENISLSSCEVQSVCDYLVAPNGTIEIYDNASGCNSQEEVEAACDEVSIEELGSKENFTISPNPIGTATLIEYSVNTNTPVTIQILDISGREIIELVNEYQQHGEQKVIFNTAGLPAGVYFCVLKTNNGIQTTKMIKL